MTLLPFLALSASALSAQAVPQNQIIEVPFRTAETAIIVDAKVNGKPVALMFDSGFSGHIKLGDHVNVGPASGTMTLRDFVGQFQAKTVKLNTLSLGDEKLDPPNGEIVQMGGDYTDSYGMRCDGILGLAPFVGHPFEINFERKVFRFFPKSFDVRNMPADNKKSWLVRMLPTGNDSIELRVTASNGERMTLALDTGNSFYATTHKDVLERVGLWQTGNNPQFPGVSFVASGPVVSWNIKIPEVNIYGVPVENSVWNIIDLPSSSAEGDGTVGFGFLKHFNIIVDLERRHVHLTNWTGKVTEDAEASVGVFAFYDRQAKRVRVWNVTPGSPAARAGVQRGDAIIGIDGRDLTTVGWRTINAMLSGTPGSTVRVDLSRNGNFQRVELKRELLVNQAKN